MLFRLQLHHDSSYTSHVSGNGRWRDGSAVERRGSGSSLGSLRAAEGGKSGVSTVKSPEEKKQLSLERDRRNRYGENSKSSRKSIQRGKQRQHMDERRAVGEVLGRLKGNIREDEATAAELLVKIKIADSRGRGFKKRPDTPLGVVLAAKMARNKSK